MAALDTTLGADELPYYTFFDADTKLEWQQRVDAMRSAIIFGLEPVFAALTAWLMLGEKMGWMAMGGAALVVVALVFSQMAPAQAPAGTPQAL